MQTLGTSHIKVYRGNNNKFGIECDKANADSLMDHLSEDAYLCSHFKEK